MLHLQTTSASVAVRTVHMPVLLHKPHLRTAEFDCEAYAEKQEENTLSL